MSPVSSPRVPALPRHRSLLAQLPPDRHSPEVFETLQDNYGAILVFFVSRDFHYNYL